MPIEIKQLENQVPIDKRLESLVPTEVKKMENLVPGRQLENLMPRRQTIGKPTD